MRRRIDVAVGRPHRHAEGVLDLLRAEHLVVAHETGQNGQTRGIGRRPAVRPAAVDVQVEECPRPRVPPGAVEEHVVQLVQMPRVAIDDEQVTIAGAALIDVAGRAALDKVRLGRGFRGNRIERVAHAGRWIRRRRFRPSNRRSPPAWRRCCRPRRRESRSCRRFPVTRRRQSPDAAGASCRR